MTLGIAAPVTRELKYNRCNNTDRSHPLFWVLLQTHFPYRLENQIMLPIATKTELENHRELHEHAHQLTRYCRRHGGEVEVIGAAPLNTKPRTYNPGPGQNIWTVTRLEDDPLVRRGEMAIPKNQYENLERINDSGVEFTELLIAHELPPNAIATSRNGGWRDLNSYDLSALEHNARVPAPLPAVRETRRVGDQIEHLTRRTIDGVSQLARTGDTIGRSTWKIGLGAATGVAAALVALDPIIIGNTTLSGDPNEGEPAAHYVLARWDW